MAGIRTRSGHLLIAPNYWEVIATEDGASAYWRLDELTGNFVDKMTGVSAVPSGGITRGVPGVLGDGNVAATFDGSTGKAVTAPAITLAAAFSVEAWVRTTWAVPSLHKAFFSNRKIGPPRGGYFGMVNDGVGKGTVFVYQDAATPPSVTGTRKLNDGDWHYVVVTSTGTTTAIYVDGVLDLSVGQTRAVESETGSIGWDSNANTFWEGTIDELAIYPAALTPAQISRHYGLRKS